MRACIITGTGSRTILVKTGVAFSFGKQLYIRQEKLITSSGIQGQPSAPDRNPKPGGQKKPSNSALEAYSSLSLKPRQKPRASRSSELAVQLRKIRDPKPQTQKKRYG